MELSDVIIKQLEAEINAYKRDFDKSARQSKKRREILVFLAEKLCDSAYGKEQLGGRNGMSALSDEDLRDFIAENVLQQKINFTTNLIELQKLYLAEIKEKENLAQQILKLQEQLEMQQVTQSARKESSMFVTPDTQTAAQDIQNEKEIHITATGVVKDVEKEYAKLSMYHLAILQALGEFGYSETNDIIKKATELTNIKDTLVRQNLEELVKSGIINQTKNATPVRKNLYLYSLSDLGCRLYKKHFDKQPVKSEMQKIAEQHDNIIHGYGIKDLAEIVLKANGRTNICYDSTQNQYTLPGMPGQRYVPDITSTLDGKTKEYWEYELGHHTQEDFNRKLLKAAVLTKELYIITPDKVTKDKISKQLEEFMSYLMVSDKTIQLKVYFGTVKELQDGVLFRSNACLIEIS